MDIEELLTWQRAKWVWGFLQSLDNGFQDGNIADTDIKKGEIQNTDRAVISRKIFREAVTFKRVGSASRTITSCLSCELIQHSGDLGSAISFPWEFDFKVANSPYSQICADCTFCNGSGKSNLKNCHWTSSWVQWDTQTLLVVREKGSGAAEPLGRMWNP